MITHKNGIRGKQWIQALGLALTASLLTSCGQQPFIATSSIEAANAPGTFTVPAKVDILLVEDDTGSMNEIYPQISSAMPGLLNTLESKGWDYHFATIPLTSFRNIDQVAASHYDGNWGSAWIPPFPGAAKFGPGTVASSVFRTPSTYDAYLKPGDILTTNGKEWGLDNITNSIFNALNSNAHFLRPDAMLAILVVGNGNDTSRVNFCTRSDGLTVPCDTISGAIQCNPLDMSQWGAPGATCASGALSLNYYKSLLTNNIKASPEMVKFYAAVSNQRVTNGTCQGANADIGKRYQQMATTLGGNYYDICSGQSAVGAALSSLSNDLLSVRLSMETEYLPISQEPDPSTIVVTRNDGVIIPQSSTNGWTYAGYVTAYQIDSPIHMNQFTGYAIQLHGTYKLQGSQSAQVTYTQKGLHSSGK